MKLEVFDVSKAQLWDSYIDSSINGTLYHSWDWLKIVEKHSKYKLYPLVFYDKDDDKPFGLFPVFHKKLCGVSMVFSPPPGSAITLGPALLDKGYKQHRFELASLAFQKSIDEFIKQLKADYVLISTSPGLSDMRPFQWAGYDVRPSYTYFIDLEQDIDYIFKQFSRTLQKHINRGFKKEFQFVQRSTVDSINIVYKKIAHRYKEQKLQLSINNNYMVDLFNQYGKQKIRTYFLTDNDIEVAGVICIMGKNIVSEWVGAYRSPCEEANELLRWKCICQAKEENYKCFEIIGANTPNLCNSKAQYNPSVTCSFQLNKSNIKGKLAERAYHYMKRIRAYLPTTTRDE